MRGLYGVLRRFFPYFKDYIPQFTFAIIGMVFASLGTAFSAYLVKPVLDDIFINKNEDMLYLLPYAIIAVYFAKEAGRYAQAYFTAYIGQDVVRRFRNQLLEKMLVLDLNFFHQFRSGELISRNINDIERIRNVVSNMIPLFIREAVTIIGLLAVVIYQSLHLSFFALIIMPLALYPLSRLAKKMKKISFKSQEKTSDITSILSEIFNNVEVIKTSNAQNYELEKFKKQNFNFFKLNMKAVKVSELSSPLMEVLGSIGVAIVIIIGGKEVIDGSMSVGSFFSFLAALFMLYTPIKRISKIFNDMQDAIAAGERTFYILDQEPSIKSGYTPLPLHVKDIEFKNVSLDYGKQRALNGINLHVKRGDFVALVGSSGGGKTSLVNMLVRFFDATSGEILLNDIDIKTYNLHQLRDKIAYVTQRVYIFNDSVASNVAYGKEIDEKKVIQALKKANAYDFVQKLEQGIHTILDEFGTNLSGGQRQRIAIARALYRDPEILILDEATSALDNTSEQKITQVLENVIKDKITFVIAHRLSTVKKANKVAMLKHGKIHAFGSFEALEKTNEEFQKLQGSYGIKGTD